MSISPLKTAVTLLLPGVKSVSFSIGTRISLLAPFAAIVIFSSVTLTPVFHASGNFSMIVIKTYIIHVIMGKISISNFEPHLSIFPAKS